MAIDDMAGMIQTVTGPISPEKLGVTLTHEHLLIDATALLRPPAEASAREMCYRPVEPESAETLAYLRAYAMPNINVRLLDVSTAIEEAMLYKQYGGDSLVDTTSIGIARDPVALARISRATGLNIIMGASYYVHFAHPADMDSRSQDDLTEQIVRDVTEGVDGTGIKSGVIGEVGCSWPLNDNERKVLRASGRAQRLTGAPLSIHPGRDESAPSEVLDILGEVGADMDHTIMGHIERTVFHQDVLKEVAEGGCYVEWDLFGNERSYYDDGVVVRDLPSDATRMDQIAWLASQGYGDKILIAHDLAHRYRLIKYGGHGYCYILAHIVPRMRSRGFSEELIHKILVDNPKAALTFSKPAGA